MNIFLIVFNNCINAIKKDKIIMKQIELIALLGSVRENECIFGYSDLDILIILKSNKYGTFKKNVILQLKEIIKKNSKNHQIKISFLTHTFDDFKNYVDIEYLYHYSWGEVVYSKEKSLKKEIEFIMNSKGGFTSIKPLMIYNLRHARFNILREYISLNSYNTSNYFKNFGWKIIDKIFEISDWVLIYDEIWSKNKQEIVFNIKKLYSNKLNINTLEKLI